MAQKSPLGNNKSCKRQRQRQRQTETERHRDTERDT